MNTAFWRAFFTSIRLIVVTIVLVGVIYPLAVWAVGAVAFRAQAGGSMVTSGGSVVGSRLIGQSFTSDRYFHGRPSAAGTGYDAMASAASNLGPTNRSLIETVTIRVAEVERADGAQHGTVPVDLVTASGSGLDPDISPDAAYLQVARVAKARGLKEAKVRGLVHQHLTGRQLGFLGAPRVNVLELNLALDGLK
ncbi:MAG TPA: potassium-transporting ATPase subunit KdpC [Coriobacteriia bacterium]|jgi:K+-transporting ATPase ATPase C chain